MNGRALLKFTLRPWLILIETVLSRLLPQRQYVRFNPDAIVRADLKTRYEAHKIALESGFLTLDEVRELEELPPLPRRTQPLPAEPVRVPERQHVPGEQGRGELVHAGDSSSSNGHGS